ncbi:inositol phosphophingolipids phospholipase C [Mycena floridula]|nr:inositol phosphophingolipids phospholipase C [Mycena floridula]
MTDQVNVLSLNCWGLKYVSKNRAPRIQGIATELARLTHDIVALQEIWVLADYEHIRASISSKLPHSKFFYSGALGAGLAIFSRFPIIASSIHPYSLNGSPIDVAAGDWFVGKAAASVVILHPRLGEVQVFNTHLFAKGGEDGPEYNRAHRLVNAWEFAKLARQAAELGRHVIAAGDFNSIPTTLPMTLIRDHAGLSDSWAVTHPPVNSSTSSLVPPPHEAISRFGVTADSPLNSYSAGKPLDPHARRHGGKRLDYIFYRQPRRFAKSESSSSLKCTQCRVIMTEQVPGYDFSYSDHFALEATLDIIADDSENAIPSQVTTELSNASIATTIQALASCYRFSRHRSRRELSIFVLCLLILLGVTVGSSWLPHSWINPIFILFTIFIAWLGTTMLYEGFIYGNWECNALMNVIEELEIYKKGLQIQASSHSSV